MKGLPLSIKIPDLGCSTFIAQNKDSGYLFGRNFDMDYSPSVLVKTKPKKWVCFCFNGEFRICRI